MTPEALPTGYGAYWRSGDTQTGQAREMHGSLSLITGTAGCGTACPVVWEDGAGDRASYPIGVSWQVLDGDYSVATRTGARNWESPANVRANKRNWVGETLVSEQVVKFLR